MSKIISSSLNVVETSELAKAIARDLLIPDPIIPSGATKVNENSKKYDRGTGNFHNIQDLFAPSE
jgi:hypothetical protein